eukprot:jgi/Psemu1/8981/gm1.8981_g
MGIAPSSNHGLNSTTTTQRRSVAGRNNNSNNSPTTICSSQEVYIESLGLPYYALATHSSFFIIGSPLLENYGPCPYKWRQRYEEEPRPDKNGIGLFPASEVGAITATLGPAFDPQVLHCSDIVPRELVYPRHLNYKHCLG